jgi:hypothetical protein
MKTATMFASLAVCVLAAATLACLRIYGGDGLFVAGATELEAARGAACLLTVF